MLKTPFNEVDYTVASTYCQGWASGRHCFMARRGDQLREHILWTAKDVFLENGFERTSMDVVAAKADTSKRSLYAYFESKEKLFLAVVALVRGLFLGRLKMPSDYPGQPSDVLVAFCGRYLEIVLYEASIKMMRLSMAESARFPEGASEYFNVVFEEVHVRLGAYLEMTFGLPAPLALQSAHKLLGQVLYPRLQRALFGLDKLETSFDQNTLSPSFDLTQIRHAVADFMKALPAESLHRGSKGGRRLAAERHRQSD